MLEIPTWLLIVGFSGKAITWLNQIARLGVTIKDGDVKVYPIFWFPPLIAMAVMLYYYWQLGEPVGVAGYIVGFVTYGVNIFVTLKKHKRLPWVL